MTERCPLDVQESYDEIAEEYAARMIDELDHKPLDRHLLDRFDDRTRNVGPVCDLGCGPGQVARYLHLRGARASGVDLSPAMVDIARRLSPEIEFTQGDMRILDFEDESLGGITAFYSVIHLPRPEVIAALTEMKRVLRPGGSLLIAFHVGDETLRPAELWGRRISIDFHFHQTEAMSDHLRSARLRVVEVVEREPYPDVEHQSRRAYIIAESPRS